MMNDMSVVSEVSLLLWSAFRPTGVGSNHHEEAASSAGREVTTIAVDLPVGAGTLEKRSDILRH